MRRGGDAVLTGAPLLDAVDHMLEPRADFRAVAPIVDDPEALFKKRKNMIDGPILRSVLGIMTGRRHYEHPQAEWRGWNAPSRAVQQEIR